MAALTGLLLTTSAMSAPRPAAADTASTAAIVAGAAAIAGALIYDSSNHPYYVRNGHRYYVTNQEASWYRSHHHGVERRAYVPEGEYPVSRSYHDDRNNNGNNGRDNNGHGDRH